MKKLLHRFFAAGGVHDAHLGAADTRGLAPVPSGARPALDAFLSAIRAKDLQALGANWGDKDGAIRDSKRISRDELEKRELLLMCYFSHDSYTVLSDERRGRRRAEDDRTPDEGNSSLAPPTSCSRARRIAGTFAAATWSPSAISAKGSSGAGRGVTAR